MFVGNQHFVHVYTFTVPVLLCAGVYKCLNVQVTGKDRANYNTCGHTNCTH